MTARSVVRSHILVTPFVNKELITYNYATISLLWVLIYCRSSQAVQTRAISYFQKRVCSYPSAVLVATISPANDVALVLICSIWCRDRPKTCVQAVAARFATAFVCVTDQRAPLSLRAAPACRLVRAECVTPCNLSYQCRNVFGIFAVSSNWFLSTFFVLFRHNALFPF